MSTPPGEKRGAALDRATLLAMAASVGLMLQPWWGLGLRVGFFFTAAATLAQIVVSHLGKEPAA
jgi:hypothetical protein